MRSLVEKSPQDGNGDAMPWMNFSIVELLNERLSDDQELFEYGSGYSTQYYAKRVKSITSVEYDEHWYKEIKLGLPSNAKLLFQALDQDGDYSSSISKQSKDFDVVIIDGRDRVNCFKRSLAKLSPTGVIILDDSQRDRYAEIFEIAQENKLRVLNIAGLKPTGTARDQSSIFYRSDNCFNI